MIKVLTKFWWKLIRCVVETFMALPTPITVDDTLQRVSLIDLLSIHLKLMLTCMDTYLCLSLLRWMPKTWSHLPLWLLSYCNMYLAYYLFFLNVSSIIQPNLLSILLSDYSYYSNIEHYNLFNSRLWFGWYQKKIIIIINGRKIN